MKFPGGVRFVLAILGKIVYTTLVHAGVLELVDEVDSKSTGGNTVPVRARPPAPNQSTNFDTKTAFHFGGLFLRLCPEPQYSCGFRPFPAVAPNGRKNTAGGIIWITPA